MHHLRRKLKPADPDRARRRLRDRATPTAAVMLRSLQARLLALVLAPWRGLARLGLLTGADAQHELDDLDGHLAQAPRCWSCSPGARRSTTTTHAVEAPTLHRYAPGGVPGLARGVLVARSANAPDAADGPKPPTASPPWAGRRRRLARVRGARAPGDPDLRRRAAGARASILRRVLRGHPMPLALPAAAAGAGGRCGAAAPLRALAPLRRGEPRCRCSPRRTSRRRPARSPPLVEALNRPVRAHRRAAGQRAPLHRRRRARGCARRSPPSARRPGGAGAGDDAVRARRRSPRWPAATARRAWSSSC